jgi:hypothetical protein
MVLYKGNAGDNVIVPSPVTGDITPLALAMLVRCGKEGSVKSVASKVMWSVALESRIHSLFSTSGGELNSVIP